MRANGLETMSLCGRRMSVLSEARNDAPSVRRPEAFSIMELGGRKGGLRQFWGKKLGVVESSRR